MIESLVAGRLNPLRSENLLVLADPQRTIRAWGSGRRWLGQGVLFHGIVSQGEPRTAGECSRGSELTSTAPMNHRQTQLNLCGRWCKQTLNRRNRR